MPGSLLLCYLTLLHTLVTAIPSSDMFMLDAETRQTYPVDTDDLDVEPAEDVEDKILKLLGLPNEPRPSYKHLKANAAPQFMMHLYHEIQKMDGLDDMMPTTAPSLEDIGPEFRNLTFFYNKNQKIEEVDTVISFDNQRK